MSSIDTIIIFPDTSDAEIQKIANAIKGHPITPRTLLLNGHFKYNLQIIDIQNKLIYILEKENPRIIGINDREIESLI